MTFCVEQVTTAMFSFRQAATPLDIINSSSI